MRGICSVNEWLVGPKYADLIILAPRAHQSRIPPSNMLDAEKRGDKRRSLRGKDPSRDEGSKSFQPESGPKGSVLGRTNSRGAPMAGTARDAINFESEVEYLRAEEGRPCARSGESVPSPSRCSGDFGEDERSNTGE